MTEFKLPTETVDLPSKGLLYAQSNPLSSGKIEMKYMTAKEEDILTNQNYIKQGTVLDKLFQSMIVSPIDYKALTIGDKNAIMIAARILSYGAKYSFEYDGVEQEVDLSQLKNKELKEDLFSKGMNEFEFTFPETGNNISFKILTHGDEIQIEHEIKGLRKINKDDSSESTVRLSHMITSINGSRERKDIREFVNKYLLAKDARAFRKYYNDLIPDVDLTVTVMNSEGVEEDIQLPADPIGFFWPDARL